MKVLFNSACPVCDKGICYQKTRVASKVDWQDVHSNRNFLDEYKLDIEAVRERLHVIDEIGEIKIGIDAFIEIWRHSPKDTFKAKLFSLPLIHGLSSIIYKIVARLLYCYNRLVKNW